MKLTLPPVVVGNDRVLRPSLNAIHFTLDDNTGLVIDDEAAGAFIRIENDNTDEHGGGWRVDPDEFVKIAKWAEDMCKQFDALNKTTGL